MWNKYFKVTLISELVTCTYLDLNKVDSEEKLELFQVIIGMIMGWGTNKTCDIYIMHIKITMVRLVHH